MLALVHFAFGCGLLVETPHFGAPGQRGSGCVGRPCRRLIIPPSMNVEGLVLDEIRVASGSRVRMCKPIFADPSWFRLRLQCTDVVVRHARSMDNRMRHTHAMKTHMLKTPFPFVVSPDYTWPQNGPHGKITNIQGRKRTHPRLCNQNPGHERTHPRLRNQNPGTKTHPSPSLQPKPGDNNAPSPILHPKPGDKTVPISGPATEPRGHKRTHPRPCCQNARSQTHPTPAAQPKPGGTNATTPGGVFRVHPPNHEPQNRITPFPSPPGRLHQLRVRRKQAISQVPGT